MPNKKYQIILIRKKTMKKLFAILTFVVLCGTFAFAEDFNAPKSASVDFNCMVITPLSWAAMSAVTLPVGIAGQDRTINIPVIFTLNGNAGYNVDITATSPADFTDLGGKKVQLTGTWAGIGTNQTFTGTTTVTFTCQHIIAEIGAHGTATFTIATQAKYTNI